MTTGPTRIELENLINIDVFGIKVYFRVTIHDPLTLLSLSKRESGHLVLRVPV